MTRKGGCRLDLSATGETEPEAVNTSAYHDYDPFPDHEVDHRKVREIHQDLQARRRGLFTEETKTSRATRAVLGSP